MTRWRRPRLREPVAAWVGAALAAASALSACGAADQGGPTRGGDPAPLVELLSWWQAPGEAEAVQALFHTHIQRYPDARVFNTPAASSVVMLQAISDRLTQNDPPDLLQLTARQLGELQHLHPGSLERLDGLFDSMGLRARVYREAVGEVTYHGQMLALPINIHRENVLFYNKALFAAQHLAPPTTIDAFLDACRTFKAAGVTPIATAYQGWILRIMLTSIIAGRMGSVAYHDYFTGRSDPDDLTPLRAAIGIFGDVLRDYVNPDAAEEGFGWGNMAQTIFNGDAAMFFHGDWARGYLMQLGWRPGIDFGVAGPPGASDLFAYTADSLAVPSAARNKQGAYQFLATAMSLEGQLAFNSHKGSSPLRIDFDKTALDPLGRATLEEFEGAKVRMPAPNNGKLDDAILAFAKDRDVEALVRIVIQERLPASLGYLQR
jgi:glucose/mannose transport system substrate-binding protein